MLVAIKVERLEYYKKRNLADIKLFKLITNVTLF